MERKLICYCFGYSEEDIVRDVLENNGNSLIMERIMTEKKSGTCNCKFNHPEGRGCLVDVRRVADIEKEKMKNLSGQNKE